MQRTQLLNYLSEYLSVDSFKDYAPNGLQVEGCNDVQRVVTGVTACEALIDAAIELKADTILVHHGYFWKNEPVTITGMKQRRIRKLLTHDINLLAYHLPLDAHNEVGNNAELARIWGLEDITPDPTSLVRLGRLPQAIGIAQFIDTVNTSLARMPLHLPGGKSQVQCIAWCSGGAQNAIEQAVKWGADVYVSGEVSEQTTHIAKEEGVHYLAAGHHATERVGVKALGEHLAKNFNLDVRFVDVANPV